MKLYIARHGRTNYNDLGLCNADPNADVHLTEQGTAQAQSLAEKLKTEQFDCIYVSELPRTHQTAACVQQYRDVPLIVDNRLNDGKSGFEGQSYDLMRAALDASPDRWSARFNDGESFADIRTRVEQFVRDLATEDYDAALIITSAWIIQAIYGVIQNLSYEDAWEVDIPQGEFAVLDLTK